MSLKALASCQIPQASWLASGVGGFGSFCCLTSLASLGDMTKFIYLVGGKYFKVLDLNGTKLCLLISDNLCFFYLFFCL